MQNFSMLRVLLPTGLVTTDFYLDKELEKIFKKCEIKLNSLFNRQRIVKYLSDV
jgi:hypothetical protein